MSQTAFCHISMHATPTAHRSLRAQPTVSSPFSSPPHLMFAEVTPKKQSKQTFSTCPHIHPSSSIRRLQDAVWLCGCAAGVSPCSSFFWPVCRAKRNYLLLSAQMAVWVVAAAAVCIEAAGNDDEKRESIEKCKWLKVNRVL